MTQSRAMRVSAKADYAVRALTELAAADGEAMKGDAIAEAQDIPVKFLENILSDLRRAGVVASRRGSDGGYWLDMPAEDVSIADVIRIVDGPLANVRGERPEDLDYTGPATALREVWVATRATVRSVLEEVSIADIAAGKLPARVKQLTRESGAWKRR